MGQGVSGNTRDVIRADDFTPPPESSNFDGFRDLKELPPEVAIAILSKLNATDLCLASCVWKDLAEDEILWRGLCISKWKYTSVYNELTPDLCLKWEKRPLYKTLYLLLDEATLIFSFRGEEGIQYLIDHGVIHDDTQEIALFINGTSVLSRISLKHYLKERTDVLDELIEIQDFSSLSLCDSLRKYFTKVYPPTQGGFLAILVEKFANKFYECNSECGFSKESITVLCYSLLLLSVDLYSPHVKNKMSKREFIRNNRQVVPDTNAEILGDLYDDIYLNGHIVPDAYHHVKDKKFPFYRPYGAIFEFKPMQMKLTCSC